MIRFFFSFVTLFLCVVSLSSECGIELEVRGGDATKVGGDLRRRVVDGVRHIESFFSLGQSESLRSVKILIYMDVELFRKTQENYTGGKVVSQNGYYSKVDGLIHVFNNDRIAKTIFHEVTHAFVRNLNRSPVMWINEGMAELFELLEGKTGLMPSVNAAKLARVKKVNTHTPINLVGYFSLSGEEWRELNNEADRIAGSIAWAICFRLHSTEFGKKTLVAVLGIQNDLESREIVKAFESNYPGGIEAFQNDFCEWLKGTRN